MKTAFEMNNLMFFAFICVLSLLFVGSKKQNIHMHIFTQKFCIMLFFNEFNIHTKKMLMLRTKHKKDTRIGITKALHFLLLCFYFCFLFFARCFLYVAISQSKKKKYNKTRDTHNQKKK